MIRWISWANNHLNRAADTVMWERVTKQRYGMGAADGVQVKTAMEDAIGLLPVLDGALTEGAWLCGDSVSYADFRVATILRFHSEAGLPLTDFANVAAWHGRLMEIAAWRNPFAGLA